MSKLHELIAQLCPNGVPYRPLGEIGYFYNGLSGKSKKDFSNGNARYITYMNVFKNPAVVLNVTDTVSVSSSEKQNPIQYSDILFTGSSETPDEAGMSSVVMQSPKEAIYLNSFCFGLRLTGEVELCPSFAKHLFRSDETRTQIIKTANGVTRFNISKSALARVRIPVPPRAVQEEIARILDGFTALEAELEAELEARKKQYAYWRERLLSFTDAEGKIPRGLRQTDRFAERPSPVQWMTLGEICVVTRGRVISKDFIRDNPGIYPVFSSQTDTDGVLGFISSYDYTGTYLTWTTDGANAGSVFYRNGQFSITNVCGLIRLTTTHANLRYLYHYLKLYAPTYVSRGMGNPKLMSNVMKRIPIPLPPLAEQERIVGVLDRFEALCGDLGDGLPREIALRRKQMAYWRERLLAFRELDEAEEARA